MLSDLLGLTASAPAIASFLQGLDLKLGDPTSVNGYRNPDTIYVNFNKSGLSLLLSPQDKSYWPNSLPSFDPERLILTGIDIYHESPKFGSFGGLPLTISSPKPDASSATISKDATGKELVEMFGEPSRKGGGTKMNTIWMEWNLGQTSIMIELRATGPDAWGVGKDATWSVISLSLNENK